MERYIRNKRLYVNIDKTKMLVFEKIVKIKKR